MKLTIESMIQQFSTIRKAYGTICIKELSDFEFSPNEIDVLIFLSNNPSMNTAGELSVCLCSSKALICRSIESLLHKGLITTNVDDRDHRIYHITLTKESVELSATLKEQRELFVSLALQGICEEDIATVICTMQKIYDNIQNIKKGELK